MCRAFTYLPLLVLQQSVSFFPLLPYRVSSDGRTMGPEALFGRRNVSIMMTRSIGDKIGPRSCVAFPEISSVTIPAGKHARFVLASDGFWDVVGIESVRLAALSKNFKSSKALADWLAQKAVRRRSRGGLRQDDVTVVVVDINFGKLEGRNLDVDSLQQHHFARHSPNLCLSFLSSRKLCAP